MPKYGLFIDYEFCVGCRVCEISCQKEHNRPLGQSGIEVKEVLPDISGGKLYYVPVPTDHCTLCGKRISRGLDPACVNNCWAGVMKFGKIEELIPYITEKSKTVLWTPR